MAETRKATRRLLRKVIQSGKYIVTSPRRLVNYARGTAPESAKVGDSNSGSEYAEVEKYLANLPSCEPWLQDNPDAKASVERGLEQAASGRGRYLGSFAKYADLEIEED